MINTATEVLDGPLLQTIASRRGPFLKTVFLGDVLIVEDNFIIAMDVEELVTELGATHVHLTSNCEEALAIVDKAVLTAAILDYNLEDETSERVADALTEKGVKFVFASGHTDSSMLPERYEHHSILEKPYSRDDIIALFRPDDPHKGSI